jgi:hypothetical protein
MIAWFLEAAGSQQIAVWDGLTQTGHATVAISLVSTGGQRRYDFDSDQPLGEVRSKSLTREAGTKELTRIQRRFEVLANSSCVANGEQTKFHKIPLFNIIYIMRSSYIGAK